MDSVGGGTVTSKGSSNRHGGIFQFIGAGKLTITGGTYSLSEDEVFDESSYNGGLIYMGSSGGTLNITGGSFLATAAKGGDVLFTTDDVAVVSIGGSAVIEGGIQIENAASFTLSGKPVIQKVEGGSAYSIKLASGRKLVLGQLESGASVGITADGVFTNALADANAAKAFFTADNAEKVVTVEGSALAIADKPAYVRGDMNDDGTVSDADAMYLLRFTLFGETRYPLY
jgi:hypothetical protein